MNILIIGKSGQLGSSLINNAKNYEYNILSPSRQELNIENITTRDNKKFINILRENKIDIVINCAAYNNVIDCEKNSLYAFNINCIAVKNMAAICQDLDIQFFTFSTDYVFDGTKGQQYIETERPNPLNIYGLSKLCGEYSSLIYKNTTVIRTCGLYGLNSNSTKNGRGNFVDNRITDSKLKDSLEIDCSMTISPTYVEDLSVSVLDLISQKRSYNLFHLINEGYCTWYDFTKEIYSIMNIYTKVIPIERISNEIVRPKFTALKNTRAREIGILLPHWKESLRNYLTIKYGLK